MPADAARNGAVEHRLGERVLSSLSAYSARAVWPAGFTIYESGAAADGIFVVRSGCVLLRDKGRGGRGFIPGLVFAGETFGGEGVATNTAYITEAQADGPVETLYISNLQLRSLMRADPACAQALIGQAMRERSTLLERFRDITTLSVEQRLIAALHRFASHAGFLDDRGRIALTSARHRMLCEHIAATRESVTLVIGRLIGRGAGEREGTTVFITPGQLQCVLETTPSVGILALAGMADSSGSRELA